MLKNLKPYYQDAFTTIYCDDCLQVLPHLDAGSVDTVLIDPPYCSGGYSESEKMAAKKMGIMAKPGEAPRAWFVADNMTTGGLVYLMRSIFVEYRRLLRANRSAYTFCDWRMAPALAPALESSGFRYRNQIVWDKMSPALGNGFRATHELILEFTNGVTAYQSKSGSNVLRFRRVLPKSRRHPTEKPVDLLAAIIEMSTPPGGVVLDTFMGSGATLAAAKRSGRKAIGIERSLEFCKRAAERLAAA